MLNWPVGPLAAFCFRAADVKKIQYLHDYNIQFQESLMINANIIFIIIGEIVFEEQIRRWCLSIFSVSIIEDRLSTDFYYKLADSHMFLRWSFPI